MRLTAGARRAWLAASAALLIVAGAQDAAWAAKGPAKGRAKSRPAAASTQAAAPAPQPKPKAPAPQPAQPKLEQASKQQPRVVVLPFEGLSGGKAHAAVVRGLGRGVRVLAIADYAGEVRRQRVNGAAAAGIVAVCARLRCSAVVKGSVVKVAPPAAKAAPGPAAKRRRRGRPTLRLELVVYDGATGQALGKPTSPELSARGLNKAGRSLGELCLPLVARGSYQRAAAIKAVAGGATGKPTPGPAPAGAGRTLQPAQPVDPEAAAAAALATPEDTPEGLEAPRPTPAPPPRPSLRERWAGLGELSVGVGIAQRRYELKAPTAAGNRSFDGSPFPEFVLHAEAYPLATVTRRFLRHLGLAVDYSRHLAVSTDLPESAGRPTTCDFGSEVATRSQQLLADLVLRWPLGLKSAWSPTVIGSAGVGLREFSLGANDVLTGFNYRFARVALALRQPLGTRLAALELGGDVRPLFGVGQDAVDALGERSSGLAWAARGGLRGDLSWGLFYVAQVEYQRYTMELAGLDAAGEPPRPCTADSPAPTSGSDSYLRLTLSAGYAL